MIAVDVFQAEDLATIDLQPDQADQRGDWLARGRLFAATGRSFTVRDGATGEILMCGGAMESHADYATMWSAISRAAIASRAAMIGITRRARFYIGTLGHHRIDTVVRKSHAAAHGWIMCLGFEVEAIVRDYFGVGDDAIIYRWRG